MLALRIIATVFVGLSFLTAWIKNSNVWSRADENGMCLGVTLYGWLWRAFVIVVIWVI